jgi:hypothetical protein
MVVVRQWKQSENGILFRRFRRFLIFFKNSKRTNKIKYKYNDGIRHETIVSDLNEHFFLLLLNLSRNFIFDYLFSTLKKQSSSASVNKVVVLDSRHPQNDISERRSV